MPEGFRGNRYLGLNEAEGPALKAGPFSIHHHPEKAMNAFDPFPLPKTKLRKGVWYGTRPIGVESPFITDGRTIWHLPSLRRTAQLWLQHQDQHETKHLLFATDIQAFWQRETGNLWGCGSGLHLRRWEHFLSRATNEEYRCLVMTRGNVVIYLHEEVLATIQRCTRRVNPIKLIGTNCISPVGVEHDGCFLGLVMPCEPKDPKIKGKKSLLQ